MSFSKMKEKDDREILKKDKSVFEKKKKIRNILSQAEKTNNQKTKLG